MSFFDYNVSKRISGEDFPFYALIMAAMRQADTLNLEKLQMMWPEVWHELHARYTAPGGYLPKEVCMDGTHERGQIGGGALCHCGKVAM